MNYHQFGGPYYHCVEEVAEKLDQPYLWIGREHPYYGFYLVSLCRKANAKRLVEFGTQCGGSAIPLAFYCREVGGHIDVYDIGYEKGSDTLLIFMETIRSLGLQDFVTAHRGAVKEFDVDTVDFVHIDHEKSDYRRTFESVLPCLTENGFVVFHGSDDSAVEFIEDISKDYILNYNHEIVSGCAIYYNKGFDMDFPLENVAAQVLTYKEGPFLYRTLEMLHDKVPLVLVVEGKRPMFDFNNIDSEWETKDVVRQFQRWYPESNVEYVEIISDMEGPYQESDRRNKALLLAKEKGYEWSWIVDSDEFYTEEECRQMWEWFFDKDIKVARAHNVTYWRSLHFRIDPPEGFRPEVIVNNDCRFDCSRYVESDLIVDIPPDVCRLRHYSWVRTPREAYRKIKSWGHAHQVVDNWYEDVFMNWNPDFNKENLHPTEPSAYKRVVPCDLELPEALEGHPWVGKDIVGDWSIKVVIINHNKPASADILYDKLSKAFDDVELIDCGSDEHLIPSNLTIPLDNVYWEGAWRYVMGKWFEYDVIWVVGGDIRLEDSPHDYRRAIEESMPFGCWSPSLDGRAHPFMLSGNYNRERRRVRNVEGMCLAVSGRLIRAVGCDFELSTTYGFGQDYWLSAMSRKNGLSNYIDGSVRVFHPQGIGYDESRAHDLMEEKFSQRYGSDFRKTFFEYESSFEGNLEEDMSSRLKIVTVDNGWGAREFDRITSVIDCDRVIMRKGNRDFSREVTARVIDYDPSLDGVADADIALFTRVGSNREEFEKLVSMGIPSVVHVDHNQGVIEHERNGFLYEHESWGTSWIRKLASSQELRNSIRARILSEEPVLKKESEEISCGSVEVPNVSEEDVIVSVITPTYRRSPAVVSRCIDCMRLQTMTKWEQFVCSDGKREDNIESLVKAVNDPRIVYGFTSDKKDGDFGNSIRAQMIDLARGDFIAFFDDDNLILPSYMEAMVDALTANPDAGFAICRIVHFGPLREDVVGNSPKVLTGIPVETYHIDSLQVMVRTEAIREVGWDTGNGYLSDGHTFEKLAESFEYIEVPEVLGFHI